MDNNPAAEIKNLQEENELLLTQLHTVQEELEKIFFEKKQLEQTLESGSAPTSRPPSHVGPLHLEDLRSQPIQALLPYQVGSEFLCNCSSILGWIKMPFALAKIFRKCANQRTSPTIEPMLPGYEIGSDRAKQHLRYRIGCIIVHDLHSLFGFLGMPFDIIKAFSEFNKGISWEDSSWNQPRKKLNFFRISSKFHDLEMINFKYQEDLKVLTHSYLEREAQIKLLRDEVARKTASRAAQEKLTTERLAALEAVKKELEASKASGAEVEKKFAEVTGQLEKLGADKAVLETRLAALVSERDVRTKERDEHSKTLAERQTALEALKKELEASKASGAEVEKKFAEVTGQLERLGTDKAVLETRLSALVSERDARTKERDQARTECDALTKERDQLKKTAGDRAARIAELEAQIDDQAERQKQIDEQMVRAETQIEMLKEFLQPAFQ